VTSSGAGRSCLREHRPAPLRARRERDTGSDPLERPAL